MISIFLFLALAQSSATPATVISTPVVPMAVETPTAAPVVTAADKKETLAERKERVGCVVRTGTRIKRKDRDNCINGQSISREDIERNGGIFAAPGNVPVPVGSDG